MTGFRDGINGVVRLFVSDRLGTYFNGYSDGILFVLDKVIEIDFQIYLMRVLVMEGLIIL